MIKLRLISLTARLFLALLVFISAFDQAAGKFELAGGNGTWAIHATGERYLVGALTVAQSLLDTGTRYPIIIGAATST